MFLITRILSKVKIHVFFYVFMFLCLITGNIRDYLFFTSIIVVHEFGHILAGVFFRWRVSRVVLLPFGGLTVFDLKINTSLFEQFIVTLLGPLFQILFSVIFINYFSFRVFYFSFILLIFNLLPIYPLDGSKFFYIFSCLLFPFKFSHLFMVFVSFCLIFICFYLFYFDLMIYLILCFLFISVIREFFNHSVIFNKFLFERYINSFDFRRVKVVRNCNFMFLGCGHVFFDGKSCVTERNYLSKMFDIH